MTQKQIDDLIKTHQGRLQRATSILDENYYEFEQNRPDQYQYWIEEFKKEKQILDWLRKVKPDDD